MVGPFTIPPKPNYPVLDLLLFIDKTVGHFFYSSSLVILAGDLNDLKPGVITQTAGLTDIVTNPSRGTSHLDHLLESCSSYDRVNVIKSLDNWDRSAIIAIAA